MSEEKQNITVDQYAIQVKQTVFSMTGALGSKMEKIIDELLNQLVLSAGQGKAASDEIKRLQDLLSQNKISFNKPGNGKVKVPNAK